MNILKNTRGVSLVEIMVAILVLSVGILGSLSYFVQSRASMQLAREITVATTHAEYILEEMKIRPDLANITSTNWPQWAADEGILTLNSETATVTYANPSADPLDVTANISWSSATGSQSVNIQTEIHK